MKRTLISLGGLAIVALVSVVGYIFLIPDIVIVNRSAKPVLGAIIWVPANRVVFGEIPAETHAKQHYALRQADSVYNYLLRLDGDISRSGHCSKLMRSETGKRLILRVEEDLTIECIKTQKLFWLES